MANERKKRRKHDLGEMSPAYDELDRLDYQFFSKPIIGISRHRIGIDGKGVTTLVAFHGCFLNCKYCLNREALDSEDGIPRYTTESLLKKVGIDDIYFRATGGGICFGGGEPLLRDSFIKDFKEICPKEWKITLETSLHGSYTALKSLAPIVDEWIIDIKTTDDEIYEKYTGQRRWLAKENLKSLINTFGVPKEKIHIRVPVIPGFVSKEEAEKTADEFRKVFPKVEVFQYETESRDREAQIKASCHLGKDKCKFFKSIREEVARRYAIDIQSRECTHEDDCPGTCPLCDHELKVLTRELQKLNINDIELSGAIDNKLSQLESFYNNADDDYILDGETKPLGGQIIQGEDRIPDNYPYMPLEGMPYAPPQPARKKVLFKECAVAGVSYHLKYDDEIWDELEEGTEVALVRDRRNKHDRNAVAIALVDDFDGDPEIFDFDFILGYLPRSENAQIAQLLDMGWDDVFMTELSTVKRNGNINNRLRVSIYIQSKEPEEVRPNLLRAHSLTFDELRNLTVDLNQKGFAYFRWGGFPLEELQLPAEGEKVVMAYKSLDEVVLYLMRVLATGDDCAKYVGNTECLDAEDDCLPFLLTNVAGPIRIRKGDHPFLAHINIESLSATNYLPEYLSNCFVRLFNHHVNHILYKNNVDCDPSLEESYDLDDNDDHDMIQQELDDLRENLEDIDLDSL